ncbi:MAPEG family protein [Sulfuriflexus mobilis]|uniref:MAPEG family protein n=1 Tax=Sulfuriflexus mobilis TaxID=1811807 RepID=UPI000F8325B5|nr:MAPEG family protein [Sulfuriflexus mobilis]
MQQHWMLFPVIGMVFLSLYVGLRMLALRIRAVREDNLSPAYFLLNRGGKPPEYLTKVSQNYDNQFEQPVLFYVVVILVLVMERGDYVYLALAWSYFIMRILHTVIHTTYNNIFHRRNAFLLSVLALYVMWGILFIQLLHA